MSYYAMILMGSLLADNPTELGLRARKQNRTRAALTETALQLFASKGYDNTTIEEIAAAVDVSPRTFFRYFRSKEDVLFTDADFQPFLDLVRHQPLEMSDLEAVRAAYVAMPPADPEVDERTLLLKRALDSTPALQGRYFVLQAQLRDAIAQALATRQGLDWPTISIRIAASIAVSIMHLAYEIWSTADGQTDVRRDLPTYFDLAKGVLVPPR
jgi:AcrR family transcriptional regulator